MKNQYHYEKSVACRWANLKIVEDWRSTLQFEITKAHKQRTKTNKSHAIDFGFMSCLYPLNKTNKLYTEKREALIIECDLSVNASFWQNLCACMHRSHPLVSEKIFTLKWRYQVLKSYALFFLLHAEETNPFWNTVNFHALLNAEAGKQLNK